MRMKSIMVCKPDFCNAYIKANELLVESDAICTFPFSVTDFLKESTDIQCHSFGWAIERDIDIEAFGSASAFLLEIKGRRVIFYNECEPRVRIRFSILHEFAHFYLGHDLNATGKLYSRQEVEANYFAAQILMPDQLIRELLRRSVCTDRGFVMRTFDVSSEAAERRLRALDRIRSAAESFFDDIVIFKYSAFLNRIATTLHSADWFEDELLRQQERSSWGWFERKGY